MEEVRLQPKPAIKTGEEWQEYDLVVLATGVNAPRLRVEGMGYHRPPLHLMVQDELAASAEDIAHAFGPRVRVLFLPRSDLVFGTTGAQG